MSICSVEVTERKDTNHFRHLPRKNHLKRHLQTEKSNASGPSNVTIRMSEIRKRNNLHKVEKGTPKSSFLYTTCLIR